jgi:hypothetical protein
MRPIRHFDRELFLALGLEVFQTDAGSGTSTSTETDCTAALVVSNQRGQEEIRATVEAIVKCVVPEEVDNITKMMMQSKDKEEEAVGLINSHTVSTASLLL